MCNSCIWRWDECPWISPEGVGKIYDNFEVEYYITLRKEGSSLPLTALLHH